MKLLALLVVFACAVAVHAQQPEYIYPFLGCYPYSTATPVIPIREVGVRFPYTLEKCGPPCYAAGYTYMGVTLEDTCRCAKASEITLPAPIPDNPCVWPKGIRVYSIVKTGVNNPSPSPSPSPLPPPSPTPTAPKPPSVPVHNSGGPSKVFVGKKVFTYMGCFKDRTDQAGRALKGYYSASTARTNTGCIKTCAGKGFLWAATENGNECRCGNELLYVSQKGAKCDKPCTSGNGEKCGGYSYSMSLFKMQ